MKTEGHERKKGKRLWGGMKGKPNERGQTDDSPNHIEKPVAKAWFACKYATRGVGEGRGGGEKKEGEKEVKVFPATAQASKDTPKRKGSQL